MKLVQVSEYGSTIHLLTACDYRYDAIRHQVKFLGFGQKCQKLKNNQKPENRKEVPSPRFWLK